MSLFTRLLASLGAVTLSWPPALARAQDPATPPPPPPPTVTSPGAAPVTTQPVGTPPVESQPVEAPSSGDEYDTLRRTLPNDYDINYTFTEPDRRRKFDNDPGRAAKSAARMGIAGATLTLVGLVGGITTVTAGLVIADKAKDDLEKLGNEEMMMPATAIDYTERTDLLKRGEAGDRTAIIGGAISGGALAIGMGLLLGANSMRKRTYGPTDTTATPTTSGRQPLSAKTRTNLAIYGTLLALYGVVAVVAGAVLVKNDDSKKKRNGIILLASGGVLAAVSIPMFAVLAIDKRRRSTVKLNMGPTFVRRGGGAQLSLRF
jgi:hypothetical protein